MAGLEQSPEPIVYADQGKTEKDTTNGKGGADKLVYTNVINNDKNQVGGGSNVITDEERDEERRTDIVEEEAEARSSEILGNPETKDQINQLKKLGEKYNNGELKDIQKKQYEDLMTTIRTELDRDIPTVIEMNNEIDINYYNSRPEEAERFSNEIVNNYENMNNVQLVYSVVSRREYLGEDSKQKLDTVINNVINNLDENAKAILKNETKEDNN